jgi:hypothetical protein
MPSTSLSRRLVLRGFAGLGIALPALEFTHGNAWAQAAVTAAAKRFIVFFEHGGTISTADRWGGHAAGPQSQICVVDAWRATNDGVTDQTLAGKLGDIHQPLVGLEDDLLLLRGINNLAVMQQSQYNGDHGWSNGTALTNAMTYQATSDGFFNAKGPSIDAVIAQRMAQTSPVPFPSVNLEIAANNYGTPFFSGPDQAVEGEWDPNAAFSRLFANVTTGSQPDPMVARAHARKKSVLDGVSQGLSLYRTKLSAADQQTIDAHLTLIRGIELQLQQLPTSMASCTKPAIGGGPFGDSYGQGAGAVQSSGPAQVDILIAALACGLTNVGTLNIGDFYNDWMNDPYPASFNIGHSLDHSADDTAPGNSDAVHFNDWYKTMLDNRQWRASMFARLLKGLKAMPEGNGSMLDNSLVLWTSEFSYGGQHSSADLPVMLAGKAGGALKTGRHIQYAKQVTQGGYAGNPDSTGNWLTSATLNNLFTTCLQACGYSDSSFGATFNDFYSPWDNTLITRSVNGPLPGLIS